MGYQPLEELLPQSKGSRYKLVIMASIRAGEIAEGLPKLIEFANSDKPATIALEELRHGKIDLDTNPRSKAAQEEQKTEREPKVEAKKEPKAEAKEKKKEKSGKSKK